MKKTVVNQYLLFVMIASLLSSCIATKRRYMDGYDLSFFGVKKEKRISKTVKEKTNDSETNALSNNIISKPQNSPIINTSQASIKKDVVLKTHLANTLDTPCDSIILNDGDKITGKVIEIGITEIKYKKCDYVDGPTYVVLKKDIQKIKYSNGSEDIITQYKKKQLDIVTEYNEKEVEKNRNENNTNNNKKTRHNTNLEHHPMAIASLIMGILSFFTGITSILAVVFGAIALSNIYKNPDVYRGRNMALAGILIGALYIVLMIAVITIIFL